MRVIKAMAIGALLTLAACGGGGGSGDQAKVADVIIEQAKQSDGLDLDKDCVQGVTAKLSDDDAKALLDAGVEGDANLSPEGEALSAEILSCVSKDAFLEQVLSSVPEEQRDCVKDKIEDIDLAEIAKGGQAAQDFGAALSECAGG